MKNTACCCLLALATWFTGSVTAADDQHGADSTAVERARFLCQWRQTQNLAPNPNPLEVCEHPEVPPAVAHEQVNKWLDYWPGKIDVPDGVVPVRDQFENAWSHDQQTRGEELWRQQDAVEETKLLRDVQKRPSVELCLAYHDRHSKVARDELRRRGAISAGEWKLVDSEKVGVGMSEVALLCSWGTTEANRTVFSSIVHKQYVYGDTYVYVENGRVTSFQDRQ